MDIVLQQLVNAVALGGTYALLALGLAIVFSVMGLINFAHGELMTATGYGIFFALAAGLPFTAGACCRASDLRLVLAVSMERVAFRPVRRASPTIMLLTSFAVSTILHILMQNLISARPKAIPIPDTLAGAVSIGSHADRHHPAAFDSRLRRCRWSVCSSSSARHCSASACARRLRISTSRG